MSETRFSLWHLLLFTGAVILVCGLAFGGGLALGFQWGKATGQATLARRAAGALGPGSRVSPLLPPEGLPAPREPSDERPYLGVTFRLITPDLAEEEGLKVHQGALILEVVPEGPAEEAGVEVGDIVLEVDGQAVDARHSLRERILAHDPGDQVVLTILRGGERLRLTVRLGEAPSGWGLELPPFEGGEGPRFRFRIECWPEPCPFLGPEAEG